MQEAVCKCWQFANRPWLFHALALAGMLLLVFWTFGPALSHPPREDQWPYLLDTIGEDHFLPLVRQTYSYNRSRKVGPGDYPLFRPVLFTLLSAEKALFDARYRAWNLVGILIHCAIAGVFLSLLLRLARLFPAGSPSESRFRTVLAYVVAGFFGVNFAGTEMVIWCHIQGYMVYVLCVLGALRLLVDDLCGVELRGRSAWRVIAAFCLLLVAAFAYEVGSVFAACIGCALCLSAVWRGRVRQGLYRLALFGAILPIYLSTNWLDRLVHAETRPDITESAVLNHIQPVQTICHAGRYLLFTLCQPYFPSAASWQFDSRILLWEPGENPDGYLRLKPASLVSYGVVGVGAGFAFLALARMLRDRQQRRSAVLLLVLAGMILLHLSIIVLGRMNLRPGPKALAMNSYYAYPPLLASLVGLYFLWIRGMRWSNPRALPEACTTCMEAWRSRLGRIAPLFLLAGLIILSLVSANKVHAMTKHIRAYYRPRRMEMAALQKIIDAHRHDRHFMIAFDPETYYSLSVFHGLPRLHVLFASSIDFDQPTHVLCGRGAELLAIPAAEYRRVHGCRYQSLPKYVQPAPHGFMVFQHNGRFFGLHWIEGCFRPDRTDFRHLLAGESVAEVLEQIPQAVHQFEEEAAARQNGHAAPRNSIPLAIQGQQ